MKYYCNECKLAVIVLPEQEPIKGCKCNAPIVANMSSSMIVKAGVSA